MNIVIFSHYSCLETDGPLTRHLAIAEQMTLLDCDVTIYAARWHHYIKNSDERRKLRFVSYVGESKRVKYVTIPTFRHKNSKSILRIANWFVFALVSFIHCVINTKKTVKHVFISSSPSLVSSLSAITCRKFIGGKYVFEFRDIWPHTLHVIGNMPTTSWVYRFLYILETISLKNADLVVSNLAGGGGYIVDRLKKAAPFMWVPNGISIEILEKSSNRVVECSSEKNVNKIVFGYMGSLGEANNVDVMIDAFGCVDKYDSSGREIVFRIYGSGGKKKDMIKRASLSDGATIEFYDSVPKLEVFNVVSSFHCCVIAYKKSSIYKYGVAANKYFDYMNAAVPIVSLNGGGHDPVALYDCGYVGEGKGPDLADLIMKVCDSTHDELREMGLKGKKAVIDTHNFGCIASDFVERLRSL